MSAEKNAFFLAFSSWHLSVPPTLTRKEHAHQPRKRWEMKWGGGGAGLGPPRGQNRVGGREA
jgi:hypothetical protein